MHYNMHDPFPPLSGSSPNSGHSCMHYGRGDAPFSRFLTLRLVSVMRMR